eukprot:CAMPEP_0168755154 /NCGR_PEP_ID=MMETSP0724-20121128/19904_1 /TAXON_ID=265536 /ORGANISM="Amphiprora sp., Strain CCMP467" /LENGTH=161 /DNA_ID=CAMNT_0008803723 /DNA_START=46 /DNA_END=528 /DNA_ORIENTATION=+
MATPNDAEVKANYRKSSLGPATTPGVQRVGSAAAVHRNAKTESISLRSEAASVILAAELEHDDNDDDDGGDEEQGGGGATEKFDEEFDKTTKATRATSSSTVVDEKAQYRSSASGIRVEPNLNHTISSGVGGGGTAVADEKAQYRNHSSEAPQPPDNILRR